MAPPDAVAFHGDLSALIESGIAEEQARHVRASERTEMVWEARRGVCRLTQYYVQVGGVRKPNADRPRKALLLAVFRLCVVMSSCAGVAFQCAQRRLILMCVGSGS
jgi:hypothetical protein